MATKNMTRTTKSRESATYLPRHEYKACIDGLMGQGLDHADAVDTLKIGLRQANGLPVAVLASITMPAEHMAA